MHGINIKRRDLAHALAALHSAANDFVVDIGDIAHILDLVAAATQPALHYVEADQHARMAQIAKIVDRHAAYVHADLAGRSEEHTSELQSLMRISYAVFCLKKKKVERQT